MSGIVSRQTGQAKSCKIQSSLMEEQRHGLHYEL